MIVEAVDKAISVRGNNTAGELVHDMYLPQIPRCYQTTLHAPEHTGDTVRRALNRQIAPVGQVPTGFVQQTVEKSHVFMGQITGCRTFILCLR